jgi:PPOX class probable F420-dependent enzyme
MDKNGNNGTRKNNNNNKSSTINADILSEPILKLFKNRNFAFIATINKDGSPQVTPTWVDIDEENGTIIINTAIGRVKQKNVSRDPRVSISLVDEYDNPYSMVTVKGKVIEQTINGADEHIDKLARKYLNSNRYPGHSPNIKRIILIIKPEKIFYLPPRYTEYLEKNKK